MKIEKINECVFKFGGLYIKYSGLEIGINKPSRIEHIGLKRLNQIGLETPKFISVPLLNERLIFIEDGGISLGEILINNPKRGLMYL